jgi:hypothetical protein
VAIDGWGCGGKTALWEGLLDRLEPDATYLGMDEFFAAYPFPPLDPFPLQHLRWDEIRTALEGLRWRGLARPRLFDWNTRAIGAPTEIRGPVVLVEGLFSMRPDLRALYDLRIWVQSRTETRPLRVAQRDGPDMPDFWAREWDAREAAVFACERPWEAADILVAGAETRVGDLARLFPRPEGGSHRL